MSNKEIETLIRAAYALDHYKEIPDDKKAQIRDEILLIVAKYNKQHVDRRGK